MTVTEVLEEAFHLYTRFFWRSIATPLVALTGALLYFRVARISVGVDPGSNPSGT
jgi:hypothetical protein